ncbi:Succinate dehydrogenase/fumarate reductase, flavoprotein subunit [Sanguibacter gelidistatuariae]|uniref:Succinate dehydrogenase/fumarate reductase, flavoprotein subunit n=1 Tax=Sanguibacter gelidistatuariae TaxID=1814289 RepID=A0A1G6UXM8_9MICO|nr:FAD-binding protein [Sanguibacter gelidistatuariae]SDD46072.1 Succinate dehydrogenase/fumarate reductase, flavoprotein subunit [Sanguibacter gelidistatuariae]
MSDQTHSPQPAGDHSVNASYDLETVRIAGFDVPVVSANTVIVGTGSAGFCAADRLWEFGQEDIVMVADKVNAGSSRNAGSDKQTYYKMTLSGGDGDSVREMAQTLFSGGAMDGDNALCEAALSARGFLRLCELGVPFPQNRFGEFVGYKTDHDPRRRATSVGPYTSRSMVEQLEKKVHRNGTRIYDRCRVVDVLTRDIPAGAGRTAADLADLAGAAAPAEPQREVVGLLCLRTDVVHDGAQSPYVLFRATNLVYATGGPAGMYATSVFPNGQWGASGAAYRAGVHGKNLTEWQFGLASTKPRWNVSGTYMQVMPRFVSTDADGGDEREFLTETIPDYGRQLSMVFLKGYQWPFDIRKALDGSSLIDLLVYQETVLRGRKVYLDFTRNPMQHKLDPTKISPEARAYLAKGGALFGTPIERLKHMNLPSYELYLGKNPYVDLATDWLEVDVCAQHNNGGLVVDAWWESNLAGFFPVGEAGGAHGIYRPGGAALNSGQVGATRAAQLIAARRTRAPLDLAPFAEIAGPLVESAVALVAGAAARVVAGAPDNTGDLLRAASSLMSEKAGPVRSAESITQALAQVTRWLATYDSLVAADPTSRRSVDRTFLVRDIMTTQYVYLSAMADYVAHGGRSRGSVLYTDAAGSLPQVGFGDAPAAELDLPEIFRFALDSGALDDVVQEAAWAGGGEAVRGGEARGGVGPGDGDAAGECSFTWRPVRPIPEDDDFFENVWRTYRENQNIF